MSLIALALALSPAPSELAALDFLVGHCWRGTLPDGGVDTHCFTRDGEGVIDAHEVLVGGKRVYWGDTRYAWDPSGGVVRFTYKAMSGGVQAGTVRAIPEGLDFGSSEFTARDGRKLTIVTRWIRVADNAYEARDDAIGGTPRATRYTRVD